MREVFVIGRFVAADGDEQWHACFAVPDRWIAARLVTHLLREQVVSDAYLMSDAEVKKRLGSQRLVEFQVEAELFQKTARGRALTNLIEQQVEQLISLEDAIRERTRELKSVSRDLELLILQGFDERLPIGTMTDATGFSRQTLIAIRRSGYIPGL